MENKGLTGTRRYACSRITEERVSRLISESSEGHPDPVLLRRIKTLLFISARRCRRRRLRRRRRRVGGGGGHAGNVVMDNYRYLVFGPYKLFIFIHRP